MAKPKVYVVVGLPRAGVPTLIAGLEAHRESLAATGLRLPARSEDEMFRAAVEIRREHRAWGLRRKDVEGAWVKVARRATRRLAKDEAAVLGHDLLAGATPDQVSLLVDALAGTAVHVVVAVRAPDPLAGLVPDELDLTSVVDRWETAVKSPDRLHVLVADPHDPDAAWRSLGELVGFDASAFPLRPATDATARLDADTLRLLADATYAVLDPAELVDLAEHWAKLVADRGYDVRGDLHALTPPPAQRPTDPARALEQPRVDALRAALADAVTEVGRLREHLGRQEGRAE